MKRLIIIIVLGLAVFYGYSEVTGYRPAFLARFWPVAPVQKDPKLARRALGDEAISVLASAVRVENVPVTVDAIGTAQARNTVVVRSQIDGKLIALNFTEGQDVAAGDLLARLDPASAQAQYDQAQAKKAQDEAVLANARIDLERYSKLATSQYTSRQQADTQAAVVAQDEAIVRADEAAVASAKVQLDYTSIRAPISGRVGLRAIDNGNILHASDTNGLVTITEVRPIAVIFNLPQKYVRPALEAYARGPLQVKVLDSDNATPLDEGHVTVIDNQVDQTSGTVRFKAEFPNAQLQIWPGQFVNVRIEVANLPDAMVVPAVAVQRGPAGAYLYRIKADSTVAQVAVKVTYQDETRAVVVGDIAAGQQVVMSGFARLKDGARVSVSDGKAEAMPANPATKKKP